MTATKQEKRWGVYLLRLCDNSLYCGVTNCLEQRLAAHSSGKGSRIVRAKLPFVLAYYEEISEGGRSVAQAREAAIKRMSKQQKEKLCRQGDVAQKPLNAE